MSFVIAPIVEGHGDVSALPVLLRRLAPSLHVKRPVRFPRAQLLQHVHLERAVRIASSNIMDHGGVLLVLDADQDCAARLGPDLEAQLRSLLPQRPSRVVVAVREFESWIVAGGPEYGVSDADAAGSPKRRIRDQHGVYSEAADQARLIAVADLDLLERNSRSFRRLRRVIDEFERLSQDAPT